MRDGAAQSANGCVASTAAVSRTDPALDPKLSTIRAIAEMLHCVPGWLAFGEDRAPR